METLIFNEASLPFSTPIECEQNLGVFFKILHSANEKKVDFYRADELEGNWNSHIYSQGFEFGEWLNKIEDKELNLLVKAVIASVKCPLLSIENNDSKSQVEESIFLLSSDKNIEVKGLGVASIINEHVISFASHENWKKASISIIRQWDEYGSVKEHPSNVQNIFSTEQIDALLTQLDALNKSNNRYLKSLTNIDNQDYPNLIFCDSVLRNFNSNGVTANDFTRIVYVLNKLNSAIVEASNLAELINESQLDISGESTETMACRKHARKRHFKHPDSVVKIFEDHVKNFPNAKRMHILSDYENKTISIGYFGLHLSTIKHPK
jgi:hypothetical protein